MIQIPMKVSGITSLTSARYCAGMGVQYLGIQFDESGTRGMEQMEFKAIRGWIEGIEWVGEYFGSSPEEVVALSAEYELTFWQVNDMSLAKMLKSKGFQVGINLKGFLSENSVGQSFDFIQCPVPDSKVNRAALQSWLLLHQSIPLFFSSESSLDGIKEALELYTTCGFNLQSGDEEKPGWMDLSSLQDVLEVLDES